MPPLEAGNKVVMRFEVKTADPRDEFAKIAKAAKGVQADLDKLGKVPGVDVSPLKKSLDETERNVSAAVKRMRAELSKVSDEFSRAVGGGKPSGAKPAGQSAWDVSAVRTKAAEAGAEAEVKSYRAALEAAEKAAKRQQELAGKVAGARIKAARVALQVETETAGARANVSRKTTETEINAAREAANAVGAAEKEKREAFEASAKAAAEQTQARVEFNEKAMESSQLLVDGAIATARAVTLLGISNQENMEKVLQTIVQFEVAAQGFKGLLDLVEGSTKIWKAYRGVVVTAEAAATAATLANAAAKTTDTAAEIANTAATNANTAAQSANAAATVVNTGTTGANAGVKGLVGLMHRGVGGVRRGGALVGGAITGVGGKVAGGLGVGAGGGAVALGASALAAIAGVGSAVVSAIATGFQASKHGIGGGADVGSMVDRVATWEASVAEWIGVIDLGTAKTERMNERRQKALEKQAKIDEMKARQEELANIGIRAIAGKAQIDDRTFSERMALARAPEERRALLAERREDIAVEKAKLDRAGAGVDTNDERRERAAIAQREIDLARERMRIETEVSQVKLKAMQESIAGAKQELNLAKDKIRVNQEGLLSAKERFGRLTKDEQLDLIAIKKKADREGFESLTREERNQLRSVGTIGAVETARKGDLRSAEQAGFDNFFGARERQNIEQAKRQAAELKVRIEDQRKVEVQLRQDQDALVERIVERVKDKIRERDKYLEDKIQAAMERQSEDLGRRNQQTFVPGH